MDYDEIYELACERFDTDYPTDDQIQEIYIEQFDKEPEYEQE